MSATEDHPSFPIAAVEPASHAFPTGEDAWRHLIAYLVEGEPDGMDCRDLLDVIARYVDLEALGGTPDAWMPGVNGHIGACDHCQDLYEVLLLLVGRDETQRSDLEELWERVRQQAGVMGGDAVRG
jgi:hypothetical protein